MKTVGSRTYYFDIYTKELAVIMNVKVNFVFNVDLLSPLLGIVETSLLVQIYLYK